MKKFLTIVLSLILYALVVLIILDKTNTVDVKIIKKEKSDDEYINNGLILSNENLSQSNGKEDKFYYNQLDNIAKIIYDKLIENKENLKSGTEQIEFTKNEFDNLLRKSDGLNILSNEYQNAVDALRYDDVEFYYVDFSKMILKTITYTRGRDVSYKVYLACNENEENYLDESITKDDINIQIEELEKKADEILQGAQGSNYQKIQYIHNWLIDNIKYDVTYSKPNTRNIYGALISEDVVCEGYAKSFKYLLDKLDIPCILVSGEAINSEEKRENHMWNYVKINEIWYAVDVTWDDPIILNNGELSKESRYKYFCQGDNINVNHFISAQITANGQEFEYPELYHKEQ